MVATLSSLSPAKLNTTVAAVKSVGLAPGIISAADRHSGNVYETLVKTSGAEPRVTLNMPWTCDLDGDLLAVVEVVPLAASAAAHPLTKSDSNALPTLASQPTMHTLGPCSINGTVRPGLRSAGGDLGQNLRVIRSDGDTYPRNAGYLGGSPRMTASNSDPITLVGITSLFGLNLTGGGFVQYFRQYNATTGEVTGDAGTGISITAATGRIEPTDLSVSDQDIPSLGLQVTGLSDSSTSPFVVSVAATVPST